MKHSLKSRLLSALLVLVMVLAMFPAPAIAEEAATATLVTDVSALTAGDLVVIVAKDSDVALSTNQKSNNRGQTAVTKSGSTITLNGEVQVLTLEAGTVDGTFAFNTGSGYLYAAGTSKAQNGSKNNNLLKTQTTLDANGSFTVSISAAGEATVTAQGDNGCNLLRYNKQSSLFSCYSSGQNAISLYKVDTAEEEPARESGIVTDLTTLQDGDSIVIFNPANLKALSTNYSGFYNAGTDVALTDGVLSGYTDAEVWTLGISADGSYTFSTAEGKKLSMGASYTSTPLDDVNTAWEISAAATENCVYIKNAVRGNYLEWYASKNNWSSYHTIGSNETLFAQQIYLIVEDSGETPEPEQPEVPEVPEVPAGTEYTKTATIADGDTVLIYNAGSGTVVSSTKSGYKLSGISVSPAEDKIVTEDESVAWTVSVVDGKYTFSQGDKVLGAVQSGTYVNPSLNAADGYTTWDLVESATDSTWYIKNATFPAGNYGPYYLEYYSGYTVYDITVGNNRYAELFFYFGNHIPISNTGIKHTSGSSVNGDHTCTAILHTLCKIQDIDTAFVPTQAAFDRNRHIHSLYYCLDNLPRQFRCSHQSAAVSGICDFGHRTSHIDIDKITPGDFKCQLRTFCHDFRIITKNLCTADTGVRFAKKCRTLFVLIAKCTGRYHFRDRQLRTKLSTDIAKCPIRYTSHGSQSYGGIHLQITDFHGVTSLLPGDYSTK